STRGGDHGVLLRRKRCGSRLPAGPPRHLHQVRSPGLPKHLALSHQPGGAIPGYYSDANGVGHAFLRAPSGTFTKFDPPGSLSTLPLAINPGGRSRVTTPTQTVWVTPSCGPPAAPSPSSI